MEQHGLFLFSCFSNALLVMWGELGCKEKRLRFERLCEMMSCEDRNLRTAVSMENWEDIRE